MKKEKKVSDIARSPQYRTSSERATGYISGKTFLLKEVTYSIIDDMAIFEGDIALGTHKEMQTRRSGDVPLRSVVLSDPRFRWPSGIIPFEIDPNLPNRQRVTDAIAHWQARTPIRFVVRDAGQHPNFVRFADQNGCWSFVGMQGGQQIISLGAGCTTGSTIHEIGHAVGLWHEQSREDRDTFVRIVWQNIDPSQTHNFNQHISDGDDIGEYDYCSIMHYPRWAFSINGQDTIVVLQPTRPCGNSIGQTNGLSDGDISAVRLIYAFSVGTFSPGAGYAITNGQWIMGDFNGDGRDDIVHAVEGTNYVHTWLSNGDGTFSVGTFSPGAGYAITNGQWIMGDFNGDGRDDIVHAVEGTNYVHTWRSLLM
jgi:hypothetical protein